MYLSQNPGSSNIGPAAPEPGPGADQAAVSRLWLAGLVLAAAVILAYQPAWNAGFVWDDDLYVTRNKLLTAPDGLKRIWFSLDSPSQYFPLAYTTFRYERGLWGLNPAGYHRVNIALHAANALLLWGLLRRLRVPGAWLAAALFALHPVQVESVAWIAERKNVLTLFFSLLTMVAWVGFVQEDVPVRRRGLCYGLALFFYLLALFSKSTACTVPAALLLVLWLMKKPIDRRRWMQIVPFVVLGIGMGLLTVWWEQQHQGVRGKFQGLGLLERVLVASRAVWFYAGKLAWPTNLTFSYPRWALDPANPLAYGWLLAGTGLGAAIYLARRQLGRGVEVAALFYVVTLGPLLGFFMLSTFRYSFVADHYQYVASIGPLALAAAGITKGLDRETPGRPWLKPVLGGTLLFILALLTWRQAGTFADLETLWRATIQRNPGSFMARNNLANLLLEKGRVDEAIVQYRKAQEIEPDEAAAAYNLGRLLYSRGQVDEAIACYRSALQNQPDGAAIAYNLGNALFAKGEVDEAIACYRKALQIQPDGAAIACSLGDALFAKGEVDEAIVYYRRALEASPTLARAHGDLGNALVRKGRLDEAIVQYETAVTLQSNNVPALANLSWVLATCSDPSLRNGSRAVELAQRADRLSGGKSPGILKILSAAYAEAGRFPEAVATAGQILELPAIRADAGETAALRAQIKLFEAHSPLRDPGLTNSASNR